MSDTLVIIPTYNEKENAEAIAQAVLAACPETDLLFVDDNSPDGTGRRLSELTVSELVETIAATGFTPVERDTFFEEVTSA